MKSCVFIIGTNASGKSTLARALISRFGGIAQSTKRLTSCVDGRACLAGRYAEGGRYGGVDGLKTGELEGVVREGLASHDIIFCEGSFMDTFGLNLQRALFVAQRHLVALLMADPPVLAARLSARSGRVRPSVFAKQRRCMRCAEKWRSIGVPVFVFDSGKTTASAIADEIVSNV